MNTDNVFVVISRLKYDTVEFSKRDVFRRIACNNKVIFINPSFKFMPNDEFEEFLDNGRIDDMFYQVDENIFVLDRIVSIYGEKYRGFDLVMRKIENTFSDENLVVFIDDCPDYLKDVMILSGKERLIYSSSIDWEEHFIKFESNFNTLTQNFERKLMGVSNLVCCHDKKIHDKASNFTPNAVILKNDEDLYNCLVMKDDEIKTEFQPAQGIAQIGSLKRDKYNEAQIAAMEMDKDSQYLVKALLFKQNLKHYEALELLALDALKDTLMARGLEIEILADLGEFEYALERLKDIHSLYDCICLTEIFSVKTLIDIIDYYIDDRNYEEAEMLIFELQRSGFIDEWSVKSQDIEYFKFIGKTPPLNKDDLTTVEKWNEYFNGKWQNNHGQRQTEFFTRLAVDNLPESVSENIRNEKLSIYDIGCALGDGTNMLKEFFPCSKVVGADFSESAIHHARKIYPDVEFKVYDIMKDEDVFDVAYLSNTLEHFDSPFMVLRKVLRNTKSYAVVMVPFQEYNLSAHHYFVFDYFNIPERLDDFKLVWLKEFNTSVIKDNMWNGKQILLIYEKI